MPWVLTKKNGRVSRTPFVFTRSDVVNLSRDKNNCYVLQNTGTHAHVRVGGKCRKKSPESAITHGALGALPSWWPFKSKKKQLDRDPRRMAQTIMFVPGAKGMKSRGELVTMRGAKRRRRRR